MSRPVCAYIFPNGMMIVFDADGNQVPEYQGVAAECAPRLLSDYPIVTVLDAELIDRVDDRRIDRGNYG